MVGALSFSQPILRIQLTLQSLPRNSSSFSVSFHFPISPLLVHKITFKIPTNTPFLYNSAVFHSFFLCTTIPTIYTKNILPTSNILPIQAASRYQKVREYCEDWRCLISPFFFKVWTVIAGLTHNTDSLSIRLKKLIYSSCDKPSNPYPLIPSTYFHYFHIQLIPPQELTFPWKPVA